MTKTLKKSSFLSPIRHILGILTFMLVAQTANAIAIHYNLTALGGDDYRYEYTVTNDGSLGAVVALEWFAILFDPAQYDESSLTIVTADPRASDWDELILGSGLLIDAAYDVFALAGGIADGGSVAGFAIEFTWLGTGAPGAQPFEIYDPVSFDVIQAGSTRTTVSAVPEPGTLVLLFISVLAAVAVMRRKRQGVATPVSRHAYSR